MQRATQVWTGIGAKVVTMTPEAHDSAFAAVSHLPHLLAFAFTNAIAAPARRASDFLELAGPGFRDFTRIAASDPAMWRDVLLANREQVLRIRKVFRAALSQLEALMNAAIRRRWRTRSRLPAALAANGAPGVAASPD